MRGKNGSRKQFDTLLSMHKAQNKSLTSVPISLDRPESYFFYKKNLPHSLVKNERLNRCPSLGSLLDNFLRTISKGTWVSGWGMPWNPVYLLRWFWCSSDTSVGLSVSLWMLFWQQHFHPYFIYPNKDSLRLMVHHGRCKKASSWSGIGCVQIVTCEIKIMAIYHAWQF